MPVVHHRYPGKHLVGIAGEGLQHLYGLLPGMGLAVYLAVVPHDGIGGDHHIAPVAALGHLGGLGGRESHNQLLRSDALRRDLLARGGNDLQIGNAQHLQKLLAPGRCGCQNNAHFSFTPCFKFSLPLCNTDRGSVHWVYSRKGPDSLWPPPRTLWRSRC